MKRLLRRFLKEERGAALVLTLVLLLIGGLIIVPLLGFMGTGHLAGQVHEKRMDELYAADAGVEDAIWKIRDDRADFDEHGYYSYPDPDLDPAWMINDKSVGVEIWRTEAEGSTSCRPVFEYHVRSTATGPDGTTTVEANLGAVFMDLSLFLDYAIISHGEITIMPSERPGTGVYGDVWLPDKDPGYLRGEEYIFGNVIDEASDNVKVEWPGFGALSGYYEKDVEGLEPHAGGHVINPGRAAEDDPFIVEPMLVDGDLTITGRGWIRLEGTVYVKGDLFINPTPEIHLDLNGHTIFVEKEIKMNPGSQVNLYGSGCLIAGDDIQIQPNIDTDGESFVLIMSIEGRTQFQPGTHFTGCVAGASDVLAQPNNTIRWIPPYDMNLNLPMGNMGDGGKLPPITQVNILSWQLLTGS